MTAAGLLAASDVSTGAVAAAAGEVLVPMPSVRADSSALEDIREDAIVTLSALCIVMSRERKGSKGGYLTSGGSRGGRTER